MNIKSKKKRGFTIVELVIVISVIAILAAVLIPTFSSIINKANESSDLQTIKNINLSIELSLNEKPHTMYEALEYLENDGFSIKNINSKTGAILGWDEQLRRFVWIREELTNDTKPVFQIIDYVDPTKTLNIEDDKYRYFIYLPEDGIYTLSCYEWKDFNPDDYNDDDADSYKPNDSELILCGAAGCFDENGDLIQLGKIGSYYQLGCVWKQSAYSTLDGLSVSFSYWMGPENKDVNELNETHGDGIAVIFSKTCHSIGDIYGVLNTDCAIKFVGFYDTNSPVQNNYFTLIQNNNQLAIESSDVIEDGKWHFAQIEYIKDTLTVLIDSVPVLCYSDVDLSDSVYIGISGGTGACTNNFFIRDYNVTSFQTENSKTVYTENGLACILSQNGEYYIINGIGNCTDENLVIPTECNGKPVKVISQAAFDGCTSFKSVEIPSCVTTIGGWAFANCTSLESVILNEGVTTVGERAFSNCTALINVTIPDTLRVISREMFYNCSSMNEIYLFGNVSAISKNAFKDCTNLNIYSKYALSQGSLPKGWSVKWNISNCKFYRINEQGNYEIQN